MIADNATTCEIAGGHRPPLQLYPFDFVQSRAAGCLKETNKKSQSNQAERDRQQAHDDRSVNSSGYRRAYGCSHHHTHRQIHRLGQAMIEFAHCHMRHGCGERVRTKCDVAVALCAGMCKIRIKNGTCIIPPPMPIKLDSTAI